MVPTRARLLPVGWRPNSWTTCGVMMVVVVPVSISASLGTAEGGKSTPGVACSGGATITSRPTPIFGSNCPIRHDIGNASKIDRCIDHLLSRQKVSSGTHFAPRSRGITSHSETCRHLAFYAGLRRELGLPSEGQPPLGLVL